MANTKRVASNSRRLILLLLTSVFFILGLLFDYTPGMVDNQIKRTVELATNQEIQSIWSRPPVDFHSYFWLFDILNADKFMAGEEKVRVRRVGPYHFTSRLEKKIIDVSQNKYRITYNTTRHFTADEANSVSLDEPLVLVNPIYASLVAGARELTRDQDPQGRQLLLTSLQKMADKFNESLFINTTARSALLGRRLPIVEKLVKMANTFGMEMELPDVARVKSFGYVAIMNGTWDGPYEIYSGYQASMNSLGDIISYRGKKRLTEFQGKCNRLQTSAGELRPMPLHDNQTLEMFQPRFCRVLRLAPTGARKAKEGQVINYELSASDFLSAELNPDNRCYCLNRTLNNYCSLSGALELGPCSYHSPLVVVPSHLKPDDRISGSVLNWDPDMVQGDVELVPAAEPGVQMTVLKRLGLPISADITLTMLMKVIKDPVFRPTSQVPEESFIPVMTVRERGSIPPKLGQIIVNVESFLSLTTHLKVVMYLTAVVLLCWLTGHYYSKSSASPAGASLSRITPGSDQDQNPDDGSQQSGGGASERGSRAARGARNSRVALPASGAPSDRANSADSNRSQPPSRVSHGSLDVGSADEPAADQKQEQEQQQTPGANKQHRIFSKVDEEANLRSESWRAKRQATLHSKAKLTDASAADGRRLNSSSSSSPATAVAAAAGSEAACAVAGGGDDGCREATGGLVEPAAGDETNQKQQQPVSKRNWFMKVCSNFVRMLNGIRSSINDASQLEVNENDYQDKQLEMLAGKIDSWYQSSPLTPDLSLPNESSRGGSGLDKAAPSGDEQPAPAPAPTSNSDADSADKDADAGDARGRGQDKSAGERLVRASGAESSGKQEQAEREVEKSDTDGESQQLAKRQADAGNGSEAESEAQPGASHQSVPTLVTPAMNATGVETAARANSADRGVSTESISSGGDASVEAASESRDDAGSDADATKMMTTKNLPDISEEIKSEAAESAEAIAAIAAAAAAAAAVAVEQPEVGQSSEESETRRRDSIQSNATVINRADSEQSATKSQQRRQIATDEQSKLVSGNNLNNDNIQQKRQLSPARGKTPSVVMTASAAGEPNNSTNNSTSTNSNNELSQDKRAALESAERALSATSAGHASGNTIAGY